MVSLLIGLSLLGTAGCIIPSPLEEQYADGSVENHRPRLSVQDTRPDISKTFTVFKSQGGKIEKTELNIAFVDADQQEIVTRVFIDRNYKAFIAEARRVSPGGSDVLIFTITISGLCDKIVNDVPGFHDLEVYISDSGFVDTGDDLRMENPGGLRDNLLWDLSCVVPPA